MATKLHNTVTLRALKVIDNLLDNAHAAIAEALVPNREVIEVDDDGNPKTDSDGLPVYTTITTDVDTAKWLVDRALPKKSFVLARAFTGSLSTIQDVVATAEEVAVAVMAGEISIDDGKNTMDFLIGYCSLRAFTQLDELRELIAQMETSASSPNSDHALPDGTTPLWGRLAAMQPINSKIRPAE